MLTAIVFSGGLGLASYHAGAFHSFSERGLPLHWVSGSSAGAVTAALLAGAPPAERVDRLASFWNVAAAEPVNDHPFRHFQGWASAARSHLFGTPGFFSVRLGSPDPLRFRSFYDLGPMRERLSKLVDFGRLNSGEMRVCIAATDVESGDPVLFDTAEAAVTMDHLLASCGFLPEFAPVEIGDRMYVDGGLAANAPFDRVLQCSAAIRLFVIDLFARDGARPHSLEAAAERKNDLMFGNQTYLRLKDQIEIRRLRKARDQHDGEPDDQIILMSYRAGPEEPGPEKSYNFSRDGLATRWHAGRDDMAFALQNDLPEIDGVRTVRRQIRDTSRLADRRA